MKVYCAEPSSILKELIMKVYCAETGKLKQYLFKESPELPKFNILFSYYYQQNLEIYLLYANNILIDSGAFTLQQRKNASFDKYFHNYKKFIEKHKNNEVVQGFFELDVPDIIGYDAVKEYRKYLFEITDKIIPVWHRSLGVSEFKKMCHDYEYIGVSCVKDRSIPRNKYWKFVKYAHQNNCKIHGLGMLRPNILNEVPFDSVDGTGWFRAARFGKYKNKQLNSSYIRENRFKLVYVELMEHIKFQEKMYNKWRWYHND